VVVTDQVLLVPPSNDFGLVGYQVAARVENHGDGWAKIDAFGSEFVVLNADGGVTSTGTMSLAYPQYLEPGGVGYLATYDVQEGVDPAEFVSVEITPAFENVEGPAVTFEFSQVQVRYGGTYGFDATGFVTASETREFVEVGVICLDAAGAIRGVVSGQLMQGVAAGEPQAFETTGPPTQVQPNECATTIPSATAHDR
jgi:hypothetical protein